MPSATYRALQGTVSQTFQNSDLDRRRYELTSPCLEASVEKVRLGQRASVNRFVTRRTQLLVDHWLETARARSHS